MSIEAQGLGTRTCEAQPTPPDAAPCFGESCRAHLYQQVRKLMRNPEDVEDAVQEVCMRCLLEQRRHTARAHFRTWLSRAILRACKTARQRHYLSVLSTESVASRAMIELAFQDAPLVPAGGDAERVIENVRAALQQLNPRQRRLLEWRYLEGHSFAQIAERLGIAEASARPALYRARQAFGSAYLEAAREPG